MSKPKQQRLFDIPATQAELPPWELAAREDRLAAEVVFNRPLDRTFHYLIPDELRELLQPGQRVRVPFGRSNQKIVGYCVGISAPPEDVARLKSVDSVLDSEPLLDDRMLLLTRWIADRYLCAWGQVLETVIPAGVKKKAGTRMIQSYSITAAGETALQQASLPRKQRDVLLVLHEERQPLSVGELSGRAGCGTSPINTLRNKGFIQAIRRREDVFEANIPPIERSLDLTLNEEQLTAVRAIHEATQSRQYHTLLLHGVTGSGKTEVYIQAIREVVSYGKQAIVLVPEISLTPQTIRRFRRRFDSVAVLHSHLSDAERHWHWQQIAGGSVQVVVGARSAVFAPTPHLGLIVIDEEHETSFKQDTTPRYHAREVARKRAELEKIPLVLGSATPTLESWYRAQQGQDTLITLSKRVERRPLPPVVVVDIRNDPYCKKGAAIGRALETGMRRALDDGGQVILFLNLRGFAPALWCRACGETLKCPHCEISMTWHKDRRMAVCHYCEYEVQPSRRCQNCGHPSVLFLGLGTQRLEDEVRTRFPDFHCLRMDSDSMRKPGSHDTALEAFRNQEVQILLGTQMIAKGLDFPNVTLVGVIAADTILHQPDFRASERTFQLISQVSGRTGRSERGGRVYVQTCHPSEPAILLAAEHDYQKFAQLELGHRRENSSPPYRHFLRVILRGPDEPVVRAGAQHFCELIAAANAKLKFSIEILGPALAPLPRLRDLHRYHLQVSCDDVTVFGALWRAAEEKLSLPRFVEFTLDVDPVNMR